MTDVDFSIGQTKNLLIKSTKINPTNNTASKKSKVPTTSANGVQLMNKKSKKGWSIIDIAIAIHDLCE